MNINLDEKKKKTHKHANSLTYTTGDINYNINQFNKHMGTDFNNPSTEEAKAQKAAEKAAAEIGTIAAASPDGASSVSLGSSDCATSGDASGMGESLELQEAKRYVRRYYIRPQNIFCSNKTDVLNALIEFEDQDCTVYTLNNLGDIKDVTKLTNNDVIYYYDDGILYDKNMVKIMDYDLYIKHEENRKKINPDKVSDEVFAQVYDDRLTGNMTKRAEMNTVNKRAWAELVENLAQDAQNLKHDKSKENFDMLKMLVELDASHTAQGFRLSFENGDILPEETQKESNRRIQDAKDEIKDTFDYSERTRTHSGTSWYEYPALKRSTQEQLYSKSEIKELQDSWKKVFEGQLQDIYQQAKLEVSKAKYGANARAKYEQGKTSFASLPEDEKKEARKWLEDHIKTIEFRVPDFSSREAVDKLIEKGEDPKKAAVKIERIAARIESGLQYLKKLNVPDSLIQYRLPENEADTNYNLWNISGRITFDTPIANAPQSIIDAIEINQNIAQSNGHETKNIEAVKQSKELSSYYFCINMIEELFNGNFDAFEKRDTNISDASNELDLDFPDVNAYGEFLHESKEEICCICGEPIEGYGNNAEPYKSGRCCDACNIKFVIPARLDQIQVED